MCDVTNDVTTSSDVGESFNDVSNNDVPNDESADYSDDVINTTADSQYDVINTTGDYGTDMDVTLDRFMTANVGTHESDRYV